MGTTCVNDLEEIVENLKTKIENIDYDKYKITDERFILPQNWEIA